MLLLEDLNYQFKIGMQVILYDELDVDVYESLESAVEAKEEDNKYTGIFSIVDYQKVDNLDYYLISNEKMLLGWIQTNKAPLLFQKVNEPVKFINDDFEFPLINSKLKKKRNTLNPNKAFISKGFTILDDEVYEALFLKEKLIGFFNPDDLDHGVKIMKEVDISQHKNNFYSDSKYENRVDLTTNDELLMTYHFPKLKVSQFKHDGKRIWLPNHNFNNVMVSSKVFDIKKFNKENLIALHLTGTYNQERKKSKKVIKELIKENKELISGERGSKRNYSKDFEKLYYNLRNSKLGRLQVAYWNFRKKKAGRK
ncbi:hypothetical protein [Staphylococcus massiliensis]|uniref:Uncharacterized protein n=2 Tax=Staphylococcus massiliensis TaxID=555791 RepID=K9AKH6_9STAP|nr:hypothetical protein [Staphylococcus massiliensis]EKU47784.1 hypothetical protein C273_07067 [Staphylococcus massiliensis S46]MCG3401548.1 hypothetical protein [Staphylococcus massiliensis]